ncbi:EAL domain-containing protein [Sphingomonas sp. MMS12-HWE2-04]|uniref:EAL domain-containing protein n=1 Tax=Sphingomonas sp. MMS12-HWE2-04 TaxID=3234199 RepID=UPI0038502230
MFEFSEHDRLDAVQMADVIKAYRQLGMATAFDDFGSGDAGLGLLSRFTPDMIKLDPDIVRGLARSWSRRMVVEDLVPRAQRLAIKLVAEGVESRADFDKLRALGVRYMQGYYVGHPAMGALVPPAISQPA